MKIVKFILLIVDNDMVYWAQKINVNTTRIYIFLYWNFYYWDYWTFIIYDSFKISLMILIRFCKTNSLPPILYLYIYIFHEKKIWRKIHIFWILFKLIRVSMRLIVFLYNHQNKILLNIHRKIWRVLINKFIINRVCLHGWFFRWLGFSVPR